MTDSMMIPWTIPVLPRHSSRSRPSNAALCRAYLRDLVVDMRCARRDGLFAYADECAAEFRRAWATRAAPRLSLFGVLLAKAR